MKKILLGVLLGATAMYYLDPIAGSDRRRHLSGRWADNKENVLEAARSTASTVSSVSQGVSDRVGDLGTDAQHTNGQAASASRRPEASGGG